LWPSLEGAVLADDDDHVLDCVVVAESLASADAVASEAPARGAPATSASRFRRNGEVLKPGPAMASSVFPVMLVLW